MLHMFCVIQRTPEEAEFNSLCFSQSFCFGINILKWILKWRLAENCMNVMKDILRQISKAKRKTCVSKRKHAKQNSFFLVLNSIHMFFMFYLYPSPLPQQWNGELVATVIRRLCTNALQLKTCILFLHLLCSEEIFVVAFSLILFLSLGLYCAEFIFQIIIHLW